MVNWYNGYIIIIIKPMKLDDLSGKVFGRLTVLKRNGKNKCGNAKWGCVCSCGNSTNVVGVSLKSGNTSSCGCLGLNIHIGNKYSLKHGMYNSRFYHTWEALIQRCTNPKQQGYENYGGRGIRCLWKNFQEFKKDMYDSYLIHFKQYGNINTSIDRVDNNGNYCKENCRWSTRSQQQLNKRKIIK
jgi:hypothetical protein